MHLTLTHPNILYCMKICHVKYLALQIIQLEGTSTVFYVLNRKLNKLIREHYCGLPRFNFQVTKFGKMKLILSFFSLHVGICFKTSCNNVYQAWMAKNNFNGSLVQASYQHEYCFILLFSFPRAVQTCPSSNTLPTATWDCLSLFLHSAFPFSWRTAAEQQRFCCLILRTKQFMTVF